MKTYEKYLKDYQIDCVREIERNAFYNRKSSTLFLGDSLIYNLDLNKHAINANKAGINGATSNTLLHLSDIIVSYYPEEIFILVGTNDLSDEYNWDILEIAFNVFKLINGIQTKLANTKFHIISVLPIDESKSLSANKTNSLIKRLNVELVNIVNDLDNTDYIDMYSSFALNGQLNPVYSKDGLHINEEGYELFVSLLKKVV